MITLYRLLIFMLIFTNQAYANRLVYNPSEFDQFRYAIIADDIRKVRELIDTGVNVNAMTDGGGTPLMFATILMNNPIALLLLQNGAIINTTDNRGRTPLYFAANGRNAEIIGALLEFDDGVATVNMVDNQVGYTPLHLAVTLNDPNSAKFLLAAGASITIRANAAMGTVEEICLNKQSAACSVVRNHRR